MSSSSAKLHSQRRPSETEHAQRHPDVEAAQQLKLRERQRFFEEVIQHEVDVYLSSAHLLCIRDYKRPPISSISSMEVNVDQMEPIDIPDQDNLDVFFSSVEDEESLTSPLTGKNKEAVSNGLFQHVLEGLDRKTRMSSTSSDSSSDSQTRAETPVVGSDDEDSRDERRREEKSEPASMFTGK
ncbi:dysbindin [Nematolebias whitei]|uniref:dysbindin n=1 Tax=Nematolebias whitei TaxID=451745 RepID=UPI001897F0C6|nr:dysbindin [Nematolebias whitei]